MNAESIFSIVMLIIAGYAAAGLLFGLLFVIVGAGRLDPNARGASIGFRILILPGLLVFWPLFAYRWIVGRDEPPEERSAHLQRCRATSGERGAQ